MGKWTVIAALIAALSGTASALFLFALDAATGWREGHRWVIWLLPLAGFAVGWVYLKLGRSVEAGNNVSAGQQLMAAMSTTSSGRPSKRAP